jgi:hypothetical protein
MLLDIVFSVSDRSASRPTLASLMTFVVATSAFFNLTVEWGFADSLRGDQPQSGHRMRGGSDATGLLLLFKLAVWNDDRIVSDCTHARYCDLRPDYLGSVRRFTEA